MNARFLVKYKPQTLQVLLQNACMCHLASGRDRARLALPAAANRPGMWPGGSLIRGAITTSEYGIT